MVPKTYDLGGSEVYGTAGYYQIRPMATNALSDLSEVAPTANNLGITAGSNPTVYGAPVVLNSIAGGAGTYVNFAGYPVFLGPDGSVVYRGGSLSVGVSQGPFNTPSGGNSGYFGEAFSFTAGMSATFRVGITVDTASAGAYAPDYVSIFTPTTGTVYSTELNRDGNPEMAIFEIDAATGESFTAAVWQLSGSNSVAPFGLITFDVARYLFNVGGSRSETNSSALGGVPAALLKTGAGTVVLTGWNLYQGTTTISGGAVELGGAGTLGGGNYCGAVLLDNSSSFVIATSADQTMSGVISGLGSLAKLASGTLTLAAANTYAGTTTISQGVLVIANTNGSATGASSVLVGSGAVLMGSGTVAGPAIIGGVLSPGKAKD